MLVIDTSRASTYFFFYIWIVVTLKYGKTLIFPSVSDKEYYAYYYMKLFYSRYNLLHVGYTLIVKNVGEHKLNNYVWLFYNVLQMLPFTVYITARKNKWSGRQIAN